MNTFEPWLMRAVRTLPVHDMQEFARLCAAQLQAGDRLVTLFGRPQPGEAPDAMVVTAIFQPEAGELCVLRASAQRGEHYPALTSLYPCAQIFERELWEQTGIYPDGHPWLKPVRFEGVNQQRMADYPFFKVRGHEVHEVAVGPIHASVIEPGHFRFMCLGEQVHHLEIQLGYQHRGVEALLLTRPPLQLAPLVESICGDSSVAYTWGYCAAIEALTDSPVSLETELVRGVALEMERVAMHLSALNGLATDTAFLQGGATYGRLRTAIINASMRMSGSRFGRGWIRPGGARGLTDALRLDLVQTLRSCVKDIALINDLMLTSRSVQARFKGTGVVSLLAAQELGLVGLVARASGVALDTRSRLPGQLNNTWPMAVLTQASGDCWARMTLRMREIDASLAWLLSSLMDPALDLRCTMKPITQFLRPDTLCVSLREGARGPVVQVLETASDGHLLHYKVQDPSMQNWFGLALSVRNNEISDFPICNKSFDLSYCGNDL